MLLSEWTEMQFYLSYFPIIILVVLKCELRASG
jgi:hypothetical protein